MGVDYKKQYRPDQLEPFWPNEIMKMCTAVLCTLAVIMAFAILPVVLDTLGFAHVIHVEEPADPHGTTPVGIKPEWYFLASYEFLKLMPTELLGISGKTLGVLTQGAAFGVVMLLPFWYRRRAHTRPGWGYRIIITASLGAALVLTVWGGWPADHHEGGERLVPIASFFAHKPLFFIVLGLGIAVFFVLIAHERRVLRRWLRDEPQQGDAP